MVEILVTWGFQSLEGQGARGLFNCRPVAVAAPPDCVANCCRRLLDVTAVLCQLFPKMWHFVRRTLLAILIVAVAGLPFSQMSPMRAVAGSMPAASVGMPCQDAGQPLQTTGAAHGKEMPACCPIGLGCAAATSVAPETFSLIARVACDCGLQAPVSDVLSGLAVPPEIRPPISST